MSDNVRRVINRQSRRDEERRRISRSDWYEKPVDEEKEARSIRMAAWPERKDKKSAKGDKQ